MPDSMAGRAGEVSMLMTCERPRRQGVKMDENKAKIKEFLSRFFQNHDLNEDVDIFSLGFVNSLLAVQLVTFIEQEFNVKIDNEDLDLENFSTINSIAN